MARAAVALLLLCASAVAAPAAGASSRVNVLPASSPLVSWAGRTVPDITGGQGRSFDWLGVQARLAVYNASWLAVSATVGARPPPPLLPPHPTRAPPLPAAQQHHREE